jgi:hypothetical protein
LLLPKVLANYYRRTVGQFTYNVENFPFRETIADQLGNGPAPSWERLLHQFVAFLPRR